MADVLNRAVGGIQVLGGGLELVLGASMSVVPEPLTTAGGLILVVHGSDTIIAGFRTLWHGEVKESFTQQGTSAAAEGLGASKKAANIIGTGVDIAAGVVPSLSTSVLRHISINAVKKTGKKTYIAVLYTKKGAQGVGKEGHNMVGIRLSSGESTTWFEYLGRPRGRVIRTRDLPGVDDTVIRFMITNAQAERALKHADKMVQNGKSTWGYLGPNCTTTARTILRVAGIAAPHWTITPLLLIKGVRPQYMTVLGAASATSAPLVTKSVKEK